MEDRSKFVPRGHLGLCYCRCLAKDCVPKKSFATYSNCTARENLRRSSGSLSFRIPRNHSEDAERRKENTSLLPQLSSYYQFYYYSKVKVWELQKTLFPKSNIVVQRKKIKRSNLLQCNLVIVSVFTSVRRVISQSAGRSRKSSVSTVIPDQLSFGNSLTVELKRFNFLRTPGPKRRHSD